jgi:hypothetical protein
MVKQRIVRDFNLMKPDALGLRGHADWGRITDEMDVVAARGKLNAQLSGHYAGAAVCRIACNPYAHNILSSKFFWAPKSPRLQGPIPGATFAGRSVQY